MYDVVILGAGPAGLAAGIEAHKKGANTLIIERENRLGGILKQCIHDGFGLIRFKERLTGPEYANRYIKMAKKEGLETLTSTFVSHIKKGKGVFYLEAVNSECGITSIEAKTVILANGCRERTAKQVHIHGSRPSGIYTAGLAQYFVNVFGYLPCKKCVILGSGDIGLIMARRLTLEGAEVKGVYEVKSTVSGLTRNVAQCLDDYNIPLHLSHTITKVIGDERVEAVEICEVDQNMNPIKGTEKKVECDGVILSVGLIPENEVAESLDVCLDPATKGPLVDQNFMSLIEGVYSCGNALHVNDLVDYVSESGEYTGNSAAEYSKRSIKKERKLVRVKKSNDILYVVPQYIDINSTSKKIVLYFRVKEKREKVVICFKLNRETIFTKKYKYLNPLEMERIEIELELYDLTENDKFEFAIE
ncbi:MAG: NAD(P)/FAD-dependent oxidoreductase [Clostridiales bacterium]|nr:NAD(P)/FAD-dependent oxidoreductase [Clostridiales bacterium]